MLYKVDITKKLLSLNIQKNFDIIRTLQHLKNAYATRAIEPSFEKYEEDVAYRYRQAKNSILIQIPSQAQVPNVIKDLERFKYKIRDVFVFDDSASKLSDKEMYGVLVEFEKREFVDRILRRSLRNYYGQSSNVRQTRIFRNQLYRRLFFVNNRNNSEETTETQKTNFDLDKVNNYCVDVQNDDNTESVVVDHTDPIIKDVDEIDDLNEPTIAFYDENSIKDWNEFEFLKSHTNSHDQILAFYKK